MKPHHLHSLRLEFLEDRATPALLTVNTIADTIAPDGKLSLREAVQIANTGPTNVVDVIRFAPVVYGKTITLNKTELVINQSVRIEGPGAGLLTIDGNHATNLLRFHGGENTVSAFVSGLTLTRGETGSHGGAIQTFFGRDDRLIVQGCLFTRNNASGLGGAVQSLGGHLTLLNSTFRNNSAGADGGAVWSGVGFNEEPAPAALSPNAESLTVQGCVFSNNVAGDRGAGMWIEQIEGFMLRANTFVGNVATNQGGGGLWIDLEAQGTILNSTFAGNACGHEGGGIGIGIGDVVVINTTIANNTARGEPRNEVNDGGGIQITAGFLTLRNVTIVGNRAPRGSGGGVASITPDRVQIFNSIVAGNFDSEGQADLFRGDGTLDVRFSLIQTAAGAINGANQGNIFDKPALVGPLQHNGGPTMTMAILPGSPALNAGSNALVATNVDQRGLPRIAFARVDMGAFELQPSAVETLIRRLRWYN